MYDISQELESKVITITGGGGYIGSALVNELNKYSVKKIIRISRKKIKPLDNIEDWILDLNDFSSWLKIVKKSDIIFHLSGNTSVTVADNDPKNTLISEVLPITNLVKASKELNRNPRVIYTSTATVYGFTEDFPITEKCIPVPITYYDSNKFQAEKQLEIASNENVINSISLRLANVYGPSLNESSSLDRGILSKITKLSFENKTIPLYGSGDYIRDYVYIDDVISALLCASVVSYKKIHQNSGLAFNVSSGKGIYVKTVFQMIAKEVEKITGANLKIKNVSWPSQASEIEKRNFIGSAERLKSLTGWSAKTSIEDGVHLLVKHYRKEYM
jgi:nucleoside-diphosphate-sugar epimerase